MTFSRRPRPGTVSTRVWTVGVEIRDEWSQVVGRVLGEQLCDEVRIILVPSQGPGFQMSLTTSSPSTQEVRNHPLRPIFPDDLTYRRTSRLVTKSRPPSPYRSTFSTFNRTQIFPLLAHYNKEVAGGRSLVPLFP